MCYNDILLLLITSVYLDRCRAECIHEEDSLVICEGMLDSTFVPRNLVKISNPVRICQHHYCALAASLVFQRINCGFNSSSAGVGFPMQLSPFRYFLFFQNYQCTAYLYKITMIFDTCHRSWTVPICCEPFITNRNSWNFGLLWKAHSIQA